MAVLSGATDLYALAASYFSGPRTQRYHLFTIPSFVDAFRAMPIEDQRAQWINLATTRSGVPTTYTPKPVVDAWFLEFCRSPSTFSFADHIWQVGKCCPELWLRMRFAERMEEIKTMRALPPTKTYHGPSKTKAGAVNKRMRTAWQGVPAPDWVHACVLKIVGELDALDYQAWVGPMDAEARYPMLLIHEKNLQRGTFPKGRGAQKYLIRPAAEAATSGKPVRRHKKLINPGRDAQRAALQRDSSARIESYIQADLALIAMGGTMKQLRDAMGVRIGRKPRLGSVIAYLKIILQERQPLMDSSVLAPQYHGLFIQFAVGFECTPEKFKGMLPELSMLGIGPEEVDWAAKLRNTIKKILPRT